MLDLGCGWGELLLRIVEGAPGSTGDGVEKDPAPAAGSAGGERWALGHPEHPLRDAARTTAARHRAGYLGGYRGHLGFAYLVLGV